MLAKDSSGVIRIGDAVIQEGRRYKARLSGLWSLDCGELQNGFCRTAVGVDQSKS